MREIRVGVKDLKSRLSEYLRQVKQGDTLIITEHGRPVGRLVPAESTLEERLKVLKDAGMVAWNGQKLKPITPVAVNRSDRQVSDILVEIHPVFRRRERSGQRRPGNRYLLRGCERQSAGV